MTYGYWLDKARTHLRDATTDLANAQRPADMAAAFAVASARHILYRALARHVELLPEAAARPAAATIRRNGASSPSITPSGVFLAALHAAAGPAGRLPPVAPTALPALAIHQAADAVAVAADVLVSHVGPRDRPRTQEGAAICEGGGVEAGLADIARITLDTAGIDRLLPQWIEAGDPRHCDAAYLVLDATQRASVHELTNIVRELIAGGADRPALLRLLDAAPAADHPATTIATTHDAAHAVRAARTWLWRNPTQTHGVHLRAGTQLGLALTVLAGADFAETTVAARRWRRAAAAAVELRGSKPTGSAAHIADSMISVLRWARSLARSTPPPPTAHEQLTAELPHLADALFSAVAAAAKGGELFIHQIELQRPARALVAYARPVWRQARTHDATVHELRHALHAAAHQDTGENTSSALRAFPRPPRLGGRHPTPVPPPAAAASAPRRSR